MGSNQVKIYNETTVLNGPCNTRGYSLEFIWATFETDSETRVCECIKLENRGVIFYLFPCKHLEVNGTYRMIFNTNIRRNTSDSNQYVIQETPIPQVFLTVENRTITVNVSFESYSLWDMWVPTNGPEFKTEPFITLGKYLA